MVRVSTVVVRSGTASLRAVPFCMPARDAQEDDQHVADDPRPGIGRPPTPPTRAVATSMASGRW